MTWPPTIEDLFPENRRLKGGCLGAVLIVVVGLGLAVWRDRDQSARAAMAEAKALRLEGRADAAEKREAEAK